MSALPRSSRRRLAAAGALVALGLVAAPAHAGPDDKPAKDPNGPKARQAGQAGQNNGNPGTIKIAAVGEDTHEDNNPKPGCLLRVDFYGFNAGTYSLRINAHPPTGDGQLLTRDSVAITGPRKTADGRFQTSRTYDLRAALSGIAPAKQGYHVKVTVTDPSKPGNGGKHKVAWLDCVTSAAATSSQPRGSAARPAAVAGVTRTDVAAAKVSAAAADVAAAANARVAAGGAEVLGVKLTRPAAQPAAASARAGGLRGVLPFTGSVVGLLVWAAFGLLAVGVAATTVARKVSAQH